MLTWSAQQALLCEITALERGAGDLDRMLGVTRVLNESASELAKLPMSDHPALDDAAPWLAEWLSHPERDDYWRARAPLERVENFEVPALHVGGWFDLFLDNGVRTYLAIRDRAATEAARTEQRLIIGPWDHLNQEGVYHGRNFGPSAAVYAADVYGAHLRFFDRHLRGNTEVDTGPPVRIFVMGIDEWRDEQAWPLPDTEYVDYFLDGAGAANTLDGDGVLTTTPPTSLAVDTIVYDPADPAPTLGGRIILPVPVGAGPVDQRPAEERPDVLCFTTPVLERPVEVTGHIRLVLHASSSALDTDFTGKLVDVFPDGRALYLTDGILRGRYRDSLEKAELLEPDRVYELTLDLSVTSNVFLPGHRIRLEVSSSNFPRYGRNTNSGGVIAEDGVNDLVVATNRVFHGPGHTSRLVLPIIRR
jgi:putative CocE/NonD family hydrolase